MKADSVADALLDAVTDRAGDESRAAAAKLQAMLAFADYEQDRAELEADGNRRRWVVSAIADELAMALGVSLNSVQNALHRSRLVRARLPHTWRAFAQGGIDAYVVLRIGEAAGRLKQPDSYVRFDTACAKYAASHSAAQTIAWAKRRIDTLEPLTKAERERDAHRDRAFGVEYFDEGGAELWARLPTQMALEIEQAVNASLQAQPANDERTRDAFLADEVHHRLTHHGETHLVSTEIVLTLPITSLAGLSDTPASSLTEHLTLPAEAVRALVSETETVFHRALTDAVGNVLDVTRLGRFFTGDLRKAVLVRDGRCQGPGSVAPIREIDHIDPWPEGETSGANAQGLSKRVHQLKTFGMLTVEIIEGTPVWTSRLGRRYVSTRVQHPPDHGLPDASRVEYAIAQVLAHGP